VAPPAWWRPPRVVHPAPPRDLPEQDHAAIDEAEHSARRFTLVVAATASAVLMLMLAVLCGGFLL
jgi:hypothetical protein